VGRSLVEDPAYHRNARVWLVRITQPLRALLKTFEPVGREFIGALRERLDDRTRGVRVAENNCSRQLGE
jgi:hypothetical protein